MTLTTVYRVTPSEQESLRDFDLQDIARIMPDALPVLKELQFRRTVYRQMEDEIEGLRARLSGLE